MDLASTTHEMTLGTQYCPTTLNFLISGCRYGSPRTDRLPELRLGDRRSLLKQLDSVRFRADRSGLLNRTDRYQQQAFEIITRGISEAFDLSRED